MTLMNCEWCPHCKRTLPTYQRESRLFVSTYCTGCNSFLGSMAKPFVANEQRGATEP